MKLGTDNSVFAGVAVVLDSSDTKVAAVPSRIQIPAGSTSAAFTVNTPGVGPGTSVTIRARANNAFTSGALNVARE